MLMELAPRCVCTTACMLGKGSWKREGCLVKQPAEVLKASASHTAPLAGPASPELRPCSGPVECLPLPGDQRVDLLWLQDSASSAPSGLPGANSFTSSVDADLFGSSDDEPVVHKEGLAPGDIHREPEREVRGTPITVCCVPESAFHLWSEEPAGVAASAAWTARVTTMLCVRMRAE